MHAGLQETPQGQPLVDEPIPPAPTSKDVAANKPAAPTSTPSRIKTLTGLTIGSYQVLDKIGQGGMAEIYKAYHPTLNRYAAVKVMQPALTDSGDLIARFQREAQTVAALRHPNIVQVFDFGFLDSDASSYLVMEYVEGTNLQDEMRRRQLAGEPWTPDEILHLLAQVADALDYAHGRGVIHRDVKPANILLAADRHAILTDFGLSALRRGRSTLISTLGRPFGTPEYVAPEQAMDYRAAVAQSDQYAVGCIVYEMITGHLVFESDSPLALALMHVTQDPIPPSYYVPDLPRPVESVVLKALDKEPSRRFSTVRAMVDRLYQAWPTSAPTRPKPEEPAPTSLPTTTEPVVPDQSSYQPYTEDARIESTNQPTRHDRGTAAPPSEEPGEPLSAEEARLVLWAVAERDGRLSRSDIQRELKLSTDWQAYQLIQRWLNTGLLSRSDKPRQPPVITAKLAELARKCLEGEP